MTSEQASPRRPGGALSALRGVEGAAEATRSGLRTRQVIVCVVALLVAVLLGCGLGPVMISPDRILAQIAHDLFGVGASALDPTEQAIVFRLRLPRVVLGVAVGALLAGCGATYQGVFNNPLADPYLLGVASGAGLGAVTAIVLGLGTASSWAVPLCAFVGALGAVALTYAIAMSGGRRNATSLILAGVAVSAFLSAAETLLMQSHVDRVQEIYSWMLGRLSTVGWAQVLVVVAYGVLSLGFVTLNARLLDVLAVGDDEARTLGLRPQHWRAALVVAASLGTAAAVSVSGLIGFVGLVVPHLVRLVFGSSYTRIVPLSIIVGGTLLVLADIAARLVLAPAELPIGVVTAFLGAPFFLYLLRRGSA